MWSSNRVQARDSSDRLRKSRCQATASAITSTPLAARYRFHVLLRALACPVYMPSEREQLSAWNTGRQWPWSIAQHRPAAYQLEMDTLDSTLAAASRTSHNSSGSPCSNTPCRLQMNMADSERMAGVLESVGYQCADDASDADVLIYNTCSIRDKAEQKVYSALGRQVGQSHTDRQGDVLL